MIADTRAYIKAQILRCNSDYKEVVDLAGDDNINLARLDKKYKIYFSTLSPTVSGNNTYTDTVDCTVEIFRGLKIRNEIEDYDSLYDLAIDIKTTILDPINVKNTEAFTDIFAGTITPQPLPSGDNVFKMILTFEIRKDFQYQGV